MVIGGPTAAVTPVTTSSLPKLLTSGLTLTGNPTADLQNAINDLQAFAGGDLATAIALANRANPPDVSASICWTRLSNDLTVAGSVPTTMGLATAIQELFFWQNEIPQIKSACGVILGRLQTGLTFP